MIEEIGHDLCLDMKQTNLNRTRMTTFIKAKLKKKIINIDRYRVDANITEYYIYILMIFYIALSSNLFF